MKNVFKVLEIKENDNIPTAMAKGIAKGVGQGTLILGTIAGALFLAGKAKSKKEVLEEIQEEVGA